VVAWAGTARARMVRAATVLVKTALAAVLPLSCQTDSPSYARNARVPIDPSGCGGRGPNANRGRIADMRALGMRSRVLAQRIDREALARRAHTRRKINRGSKQRPARQVPQALSSWPPISHASRTLKANNHARRVTIFGLLGSVRRALHPVAMAESRALSPSRLIRARRPVDNRRAMTPEALCA
jgi:hypothetical protein